MIAPPGASLSYTSAIADKAQAVIATNSDVVGSFAVMGFSFSGNAANAGLIFLATKPSDERRGKGHSAADIVQDLTPKLLMIPRRFVGIFQPPAVNGVGSFWRLPVHSPGPGQEHPHRPGSRCAPDRRREPCTWKHLTGLQTTFSANDPQTLVTIDREKAKAMNIPLSQITTALGVFMGSQYVNDFDFNNRTYRVYVQADQQFRMTAKDLHNFYVRSDSGQMVPMDNLATVAESSGPPVISHYNLFRSVEIDGSAAPGYSSGEGELAMQDLAQKMMMPGMKYEWTGLTLDEIESGGKAMIIFGLGVLVIYLTLSAQYESFALPFIILLAVPMAVLGALGAVSLRGLSNDVYCQIGLVMLIGLSAKNSILIVEFAEQLRRKGRSIAEAAIEAGELRLRPILMTSFAFILGILPLVFATGAGALGRHSVGTTIVGGMLLSTVLNLIFIPVLYVLLSRILKHVDSGQNPTGRLPITNIVAHCLSRWATIAILDSLIHFAGDYAAIKQIVLGAIRPKAHNAFRPGSRHPRHLRQLFHRRVINIDANLRRWCLRWCRSLRVREQANACNSDGDCSSEGAHRTILLSVRGHGKFNPQPGLWYRRFKVSRFSAPPAFFRMRVWQSPPLLPCRPRSKASAPPARHGLSCSLSSARS